MNEISARNLAALSDAETTSVEVFLATKSDNSLIELWADNWDVFHREANPSRAFDKHGLAGSNGSFLGE